MCGILALWSNAGQKSVKRSTVESACHTMIHRGPDDWGIEGFLHGRLWLAHRRLSILDLSPAGHQPMVSKDGRYWISYNGEIYNYREIRERLIGLGHCFVSDCDTEVLLAAYQAWGVECLQQLNGMWAFVIFDKKREELICCRDRFGIKPLYYYHGPHGFAAASEIRAILALGWVSPSVDRGAMAQFLLTGLVDGAETTCFENIYRVPAAHFLRFRRGQLSRTRYWRLPPCEQGRSVLDRATIDEFRDLFESSVRCHLVSHVPVGTCLSGGLDSSSVTAVASRQMTGQLQVFSSYFEDAECDERRYATVLARACQARDNYICPELGDLPSLLPRILWHLEEPCKALGVYPQWHVMKLASEHVTVVLDGQGGDETLAGYDFYFPIRAVDLLRQGRLLTYWQEKASTNKFPSLSNSLREMLFSWRHRVLSFPDWLSPSLRDVPMSSFEPSRQYALNAVDDKLARDLECDMLPAFLRYDDKMSMAFSVEARVPFLDYRLVEFLFSRASEIKCGGGWSKHILRRAMAGIVPDRVCWRRDKKGFPTPFRRWFRKELYPWVKALLESRLLRETELLNLAAARNLLKQHEEGFVNAENRIWRWVIAALWLEELDKLTDRSYAQPAVGRANAKTHAMHVSLEYQPTRASNPSTSLIVICRNQLDHIKRLIPRLAEQRKEVPDLEIIVSDDGSEDGTKQFLEAIASRGEIIYDWHHRLGRGLNRNRGAGLASGNVLIFIDGDVEPMRGFCQSHVDAHVKRPGPLYFSHLQLAPALGKGPVGKYRKGWQERRMKEIFRSENFGLAGLGSGVFSIGQKEFESLGGFRQQGQSYGSEDADFFARAKRSGLVFRSCSAFAYHWERVDFRTLCKKKFLDGHTRELYGFKTDQPEPVLTGDPHPAITLRRVLGTAWLRFRSSSLWRIIPNLVPVLCYLLPPGRSDEWIGFVLFQFKQEGIKYAKQGRSLPELYVDL